VAINRPGQNATAQIANSILVLNVALSPLVIPQGHGESELSQWPCGHDDSTINIVLVIIIIINLTQQVSL